MMFGHCRRVRPVMLGMVALASLCVLTGGQTIAQQVKIASPATGPYRRVDMIEDAGIEQALMTVTSPATLRGGFTFVPTWASGQHYTVSAAQAAAGNFDVTLNVTLPHSLDDPRGCSPFTQAVNDEGQPLAGSLLLVVRGACPFGTKAANMQATGATGGVISNCATCARRPQELFRMAISANIPMPLGFIAYQDGSILSNYLLARRAWLVAKANNSALAMPPGVNYFDPVSVTVTGTGPIDTNDWASLKTIAPSFSIGVSVSDNSALRSWQDILNSPTVDPCLNRVVGLYCERGRVVWIFLKYFAVTGTFSPAWGQLTQLRNFALSENIPDTATGISGPIPSSFCNLKLLQSVALEGNSLTSMPDCLQTNNLLTLFMDRNMFPSIPQSLLIANQTLVYLTAPSNKLTSIPQPFILFTQMAKLDLSSNPTLTTDVSTLNMNTWSQLYYLSLSGCSLSGSLPYNALDGKSLLLHLDVSNNQITGGLPALAGAPTSGITDPVTFANNKFSGGIPPTWATLGATTLQLDHNQLCCNTSVFYANTALQTLSLTYNQIRVNPGQDAGLTLNFMAPNSLQQLYVDHNLIAGPWSQGTFSAQPNLKIISVSNNQVQNLPPDIWDMPALTQFDISNNQLSGTVPNDNFNAQIQFINLQGNSNLQLDVMPAFLQWSDPPQYTTNTGSLYTCQTFTSKLSRTTVIQTDPGFLKFQRCSCSRGYFGRQAPNCDIVPVQATVTPYGQIASSNETWLTSVPFAQLVDFFDNVTTVFLPTSNGSIPTQLSPYFTDDWYGDDRLTIGLSTYWTINLRALRASQSLAVMSGAFPEVDATTVSSAVDWQPVRYTVVRVHVSLTNFTGIENSIILFAGTKDQQGAVYLQLLGTSLASVCTSSSSNFTQQSAYQARYGAAIAELGPSCLFEKEIPSNAATLYFTSRDSSHRHFVATYSYNFTCPPGTSLDGNNLCNYPVPPAPSLFQQAKSLTVALPIAGGLLLLAMAWVVRERAIRQRAKQEAELRMARSSGDLLDKTAHQRREQQRNIRQLQRELAQGYVNVLLEIAFFASVWANIARIVHEDDNIAENLLDVATVTVAVVSSMAFFVNTTSRVLGLIALRTDLEVARHTLQPDIATELRGLQRKILRIKISFIAILFDSIPVCGLNFARLYEDGTAGEGQQLLSFMFGVMLLGVKLAQLIEFTALKDRREKLEDSLTNEVQRRQSELLIKPPQEGIVSPMPVTTKASGGAPPPMKTSPTPVFSPTPLRVEIPVNNTGSGFVTPLSPSSTQPGSTQPQPGSNLQPAISPEGVHLRVAPGPAASSSPPESTPPVVPYYPGTQALSSSGSPTHQRARLANLLRLGLHGHDTPSEGATIHPVPRNAPTANSPSRRDVSASWTLNNST